MSTLRGHFLVASPHLGDPNFFRTVVLIIQHDEDGAFGLVLNRPLRKTVSDVWELVSETQTECALPIYLGGPVSGTLVALHSDDDRSEEEVIPGVYFTAQRDLLDALVREVPSAMRIFTGYSGWAGGQLESELGSGGWLLVPAGVEDIFANVDQVWERLSRRINIEILSESRDLKHVPDDASWN